MNASDIGDLKKRIKDKFNSLARFAVIAGIDHAELNKTFAAIVWRLNNERDLHKTQISYINKLSVKCENLNPESATGKDLSIVDVINIKRAIDEAGGVVKFCQANPKHKVPTVYQIISGGRSVRSKNTIALMKTLKLL